MKIPRPALVILAKLRAKARASELGLVLLAIVVGALAGLAVSAMTLIANFAHVVIYGIPFDVRLSAAERVPPSPPSPRRCWRGSPSARSTPGGPAGSCPLRSTRSRPTPAVGGGVLLAPQPRISGRERLLQPAVGHRPAGGPGHLEADPGWPGGQDHLADLHRRTRHGDLDQSGRGHLGEEGGHRHAHRGRGAEGHRPRRHHPDVSEQCPVAVDGGRAHVDRGQSGE